MSVRILFLMLGFAVAADVGMAGQHEAQTGQASGLDTAQVVQCGQAQSVVTGLVEASLKRVEAARLTNDAAAMRDAVDDLQTMLIDIRQQLSPCGQLVGTGAGGHAGYAMPNVQQAPPAAPGTPAMRPGAPTPAPGAVAPAAPAPGGVDPHAGHTAAPAAQAPARKPAESPRSSVPVRPAAADAHAGHATPAPSGPASGAARPAAGARPAQPADDHAGHAAPAAAPSPAATATSASRPGSLPAPATDIANLKCRTNVDPKTAPRMLHQGRMYYFCSEQERAAFAKDPSKHALPAGQAAPAHAH